MMSSMMLNDLKQNNYAPPLILPFNPKYFQSPITEAQIKYENHAPIARSTPENNKVRLVEYRFQKVAAFKVDGKELICLPQAFELFLKHLVGGLHTIYTKLKRLDVTPVICNVEQVIFIF
jgi:hypothetical protein